MTFQEIYDRSKQEIEIIVAAARGLTWASLTEDSKARVRDTIRDAVFALDGGREQLEGIGATAADELRKLRDYRVPAKVEVKVEAPSVVEVDAPQPIKRGRK